MEKMGGTGGNSGSTRGSLRPYGAASRSHSFVVIGLLVVIAILGFNYWNSMKRNNQLFSDLNTQKSLLRARVEEVALLQADKKRLEQSLATKDNELIEEKRALTDAKTQSEKINGEVNQLHNDLQSCQQQTSNEKDNCKQQLTKEKESCQGSVTEAREECKAHLDTAVKECNSKLAASKADMEQECRNQMEAVCSRRIAQMQQAGKQNLLNQQNSQLNQNGQQNLAPGSAVQQEGMLQQQQQQQSGQQQKQQQEATQQQQQQQQQQPHFFQQHQQQQQPDINRQLPVILNQNNVARNSQLNQSGLPKLSRNENQTGDSTAGQIYGINQRNVSFVDDNAKEQQRYIAAPPLSNVVNQPRATEQSTTVKPSEEDGVQLSEQHAKAAEDFAQSNHIVGGKESENEKEDRPENQAAGNDGKAEEGQGDQDRKEETEYKGKKTDNEHAAESNGNPDADQENRQDDHQGNDHQDNESNGKGGAAVDAPRENFEENPADKKDNEVKSPDAVNADGGKIGDNAGQGVGRIGQQENIGQVVNPQEGRESQNLGDKQELDGAS